MNERLWENYLANESREQAQARAAGYADITMELAIFVMALVHRLWDAQEEQKEKLEGK